MQVIANWNHSNMWGDLGASRDLSGKIFCRPRRCGSEHAQITVTGDTVNVASRLEALTRDWRTSILISNAVMQAARQAGAGDVLDGFRELPLQSIRGREDLIVVWAWPAPAADGVSSEPWYLNLR